MSTGKVVLGTVAGLAIGGIAGILFAPAKGSVTRQQVIDRGNYYADELKAKYNDFADTISKKFNNGKEFAQEVVENGKAELDGLQSVDHMGSKYKL